MLMKYISVLVMTSFIVCWQVHRIWYTRHESLTDCFVVSGHAKVCWRGSRGGWWLYGEFAAAASAAASPSERVDGEYNDVITGSTCAHGRPAGDALMTPPDSRCCSHV